MAVEFAIVAPILLVSLIGILTYGIYFGVANSVQQLAADAARASVAGLSDDERAAIARGHVAREAGSYVLLDANKASATASVAPDDADLFQIVVTYDAGGLPIFAFDKLVPMPSRVIRRTSVIHRGGY